MEEIMERLTIVLPEKFHFTTEMPVLINDANLSNHVVMMPSSITSMRSIVE
jgi:hypothetical protein